MMALLLGQSRFGWRLAVGFGEIVALFSIRFWFGICRGDLELDFVYPFVVTFEFL